MNITEHDLNQGYSVCQCGGVRLLQAGYEVDLHMCSMCKSMVADKTEFFKFQDGVSAMSK